MVLDAPVRYQARSKAKIRITSAVDSDEVGIIEKNEFITVTHTKDVNGQLRLRFPRGWTSYKSAKGYNLMLMENEEKSHYKQVPGNEIDIRKEMDPASEVVGQLQKLCIFEALEVKEPEDKNDGKFTYTSLRYVKMFNGWVSTHVVTDKMVGGVKKGIVETEVLAVEGLHDRRFGHLRHLFAGIKWLVMLLARLVMALLWPFVPPVLSAKVQQAAGLSKEKNADDALDALTLGEKVGAAALIAPTLLNWLVLAEAYWLGTVELVESDGVSHTIPRSHTGNFELIFFAASATCITTVCAHAWLTMGAIARRHTLGQAGAIAGEGGLSAQMRDKLDEMEEKELMQAAITAGVTQGQLNAKTEGHEKFDDYQTQLIELVKETSSSGSYAVRLQRAAVEAGKLSAAEWAHVALVGFDFFFAAYVFTELDMTICYEMTCGQEEFDNYLVGQALIGILPGAITAFLVRHVLAPARAAVLRTQRTDSVVFAGNALRGSMVVLMVQVLVLARCVRSLLCFPILHACQHCTLIGVMLPRFAAFAVEYPVIGLLPAVVPSLTIFYQFNGSLDVILYLLSACVLYFAARGQGLLHDKLFTELDMTTTHVVALLFWLLATFGAVLSLAVMWAEWGDPDPEWEKANFDFAVVCAVQVCCTSVGLLGITGVLWKDIIQAKIRATLGMGDATRAKELHTVVKDGDAEALRQHLQAHGDNAGLQLAGVGLSPATPLQRAACLGRAEIAKILLLQGNKFVKKEVVDAKAPCGFTALHFCCLFGRAEIARALIEAGANTELTNDRGQTAWDVVLAQSQSEGRDAVAKVLRHDVDLANRPEVEKTFHDDLELDFARLIFASVILFENWKFLAEGGFGKVYLIRDVLPPVCIGARQFSKFVVKVAKTGAKGASDDLKQEVQSLAKLTHVNIVSILGFVHGPVPGEKTEAFPFGTPEAFAWMMCLEYCESDLEKMLHGTDQELSADYTPELRTDLICDIIRGVAYLHSQAKVHCDLKPENILLAKSESKAAAAWTAKVADFGAQVGDAEPSSDSAKTGATGGSVKANKWLGTYLWMAPEATGLNAQKGNPHGRISQEPTEPTFGATDVFSLSLIVWEMVTRKLPHEGLSLTLGRVWVSQSGQENRSVDPRLFPKQPAGGGKWAEDFRGVPIAYYNGNRPTVPDDCPTLLGKLMEACWAAKQEDRPSSAYLQRLVDEIDPERWLKAPDAPASDGQPASYTEFLTKLGLQDKKDDLAEYLEDGNELRDLMQMDKQDLDDDILNDDDLGLDDETKGSFRAAAVELKQRSSDRANGISSTNRCR